jgi:hypothetical protein
MNQRLDEPIGQRVNELMSSRTCEWLLPILFILHPYAFMVALPVLPGAE